MLNVVVRALSEKVNLVRLACVRHAASVRPEPGSNSRLIFSLPKLSLSLLRLLLVSFIVQIYFRTFFSTLFRFLETR